MIFTVLGKPKPVNGISKASYHAVAAETALWRNQTAWVAKSKRPRPTAPVPCKITVATYLQKIGRAKLHDINASAFSIKGAIDGLVDAGVLIDDSPELSSQPHPLSACVGRYGRSELHCGAGVSQVEPRFKGDKPKKKKRRTWPSPAEMGREVCEARIAGDCTSRATESHHVVLRSRGGSDDPSNLLPVCLNCHTFIHRFVAMATERGFIKHGWD